MIKKVHLAKRFNIKMGFQNDEQSSYKLRKKPRKSWRFSDSDHETLLQEYQCSICGKGFTKIKALNAHIKHHYSDKEIGHHRMKVKKKRFHSDDDDDDDDEKCLMFNKVRKPRTKRYRIIDGSAVSHFNSCSYDDNDVDEIDHEAEEAAMVLMMLSSGVRVFGEIDMVMDPCVGSALLNQEVVNDDEEELVKDSVVKDNEKAKIVVSGPELEESCDMFDGSCKKLDEHKCRTCDRTFTSHQALGGHRARQHRIVKKSGVSNSKIRPRKRGKDTSNSKNVETNDENLEPTGNAVRKQSNERSYKVEKGNACGCLVCFKVFGSGKASGGHMRAHYHPEQQFSDTDNKKLDGFDGNGDVGVQKPMLFGGVNKHAQLVALVSN